MTLPSHLTLPPEPLSVRLARQHVNGVLTESGRSEWVDDAELAVTEVVANVVLHARTSCELSVDVGVDHVRVSVRDFSRDLPTPKHFSEYATTGRGLSLVTRISADFGIDPVRSGPGAGGKVIWFVLDGVARGDEPQEIGEEWDLTGLELLEEPNLPRRVARLERVPMRLFVAGLEHQAAVLRELYLLTAGPSRATASVPVDLAAAESVLRALNEGGTTALERAAAEPARAGSLKGGQSRYEGSGRHAATPSMPAVLDVDVVTTDLEPNHVNAFQEALDLGRRLAREGHLLVRPALEELVALRGWVCDQLVAQASGIAPTAWDGSRTRAVAHTPTSALYRLQGWDDTAIRTSPRAVVAADDSNRLIAVSDAAAEMLGGFPVDLLGRRITTIIPQRLREQHVAGFTRHLATGEARMLGKELDLPVLRLDGREIVRRVLIEQVSAPAGRHVYVAWFDELPLD